MTRRVIVTLCLAGLLAVAMLLVWGYGRRHPENVPWTRLDLTQPVGLFTGEKLAALGDEPRRCRALLTAAGVRFTRLPARSEGASCGYPEAVRPLRGRAMTIAYAPPGLGVRCPVAAALALWEWHVVQPAAQRRFGTNVASIEHLGSYSCRRIYGRSDARWSEHALANAVDVAGFRLADGRRIGVLGNWDAGGPEAAFLDDVRDGACDLFATVLSPDYNAAHRDHLHLDQASRGAMGVSLCR